MSEQGGGRSDSARVERVEGAVVVLTSRGQAGQQRVIAEALSQVGFALPGSVQVRRTRCGKPGCRCHADPPRLHGPYNVWTRKAAGKTVTKVLTGAQLGDYQAWFDNARKLRALVSQLQALSLRIVEDDERSHHT